MKDQPSKPVWKLKETYANLQVGKGKTRFSIFHLTFFICHLKTGSPAPGRSLCPVMTNEKWKMENLVPPSQPANYRNLSNILNKTLVLDAP